MCRIRMEKAFAKGLCQRRPVKSQYPVLLARKTRAPVARSTIESRTIEASKNLQAGKPMAREDAAISFCFYAI